MYFLELLLVGATLASATELVVDGYNITIENNILKSVKAIGGSSTNLSLSHHNLNGIDEGAFGSLEITHLYLDHNHLTALPFFVFRSLRHLQYLSLANNHLQNVQYAFGGLSNLQELDISNNFMRFFPKGSLYGLRQSTKILFEGNYFYKIYPKHFDKPYSILSLCLVDGVVKKLENFNENRNYDNEKCKIKIVPLTGDTVQLGSMEIKGFEKHWYGLENVHVTGLDLQFNAIEHMTKEILNDLPKEVTTVNIAWNAIKTLKNGVIDNQNLRLLDLSNNDIGNIESDAFQKLKNCEILLSHNLRSVRTLMGNVMTDMDIVDDGKSTRYIINDESAESN